MFHSHSVHFFTSVYIEFLEEMERLARGPEGRGVSYKLQRRDLALRERGALRRGGVEEGKVEMGMKGRGAPVRRGGRGKGK